MAEDLRQSGLIALDWLVVVFGSPSVLKASPQFAEEECAGLVSALWGFLSIFQ